jgi:predicted nucleic acid-binding protein
MLADIVVDTNVFLHAENRQEHRHEQATGLLLALQDNTCTTLLCVDEGFDLEEAKNRSQIGSEYLRHLRHGTLGFAVVVHLLSSLRIKQVRRRVPANVSRRILQQGVTGVDRTFVQVTYNSQDKTLTCHDFDDVPETVRARLLGAIGVKILAADETLKVL